MQKQSRMRLNSVGAASKSVTNGFSDSDAESEGNGVLDGSLVSMEQGFNIRRR